jgi:hypothetical protein
MKNLGIIITNLIKLAGLGAGLFAPHGALTPHPEALVLAYSGFAMAGAQLSEATIVNLIDRFLGRQSQTSESGSSTRPGE